MDFITGYRNVYYNNKMRLIHLWTWDEIGNRIEKIEQFQPYIYVESQSTEDARSIYNTPLKKLTFKNQFERKKYLGESGIKRIFYNIRPETQFLIEKYLSFNENDSFSINPLKIFFLDIEVYSPNEFPKAEIANYPINLITIYDSLSKKFHTFGLEKDYKPKKHNVIYYKCKSEYELLKLFLKFWCNDYPDILSGWNSTGFDIPYIINRISKVLGIEEANKLSPVESLYFKESNVIKYGKKQTKWIINGISSLDYLEIYRAFNSERESYKLDYIAKLELNEGKTEYNATNLAKLADQDWNTFVEYNIQDVNILINFEEKLKYIQILRQLSYIGLTGFEASLGKVAVITGALAQQALKKNRIIPTFEKEKTEDYVGGFVKKVIPRLAEDVITFDANSLYPNTMISLNISPETKIGKLIKSDDESKVNIKLNNGKNYIIPKYNFEKFIKLEKIAVSKANVLFSQKEKGICTEFLDRNYKNRVAIKTEMSNNELEEIRIEDQLKELRKDKETNKEQIDTLKSNLNKIKLKIKNLFTEEQAIKILLNSTYGVFGTPHSPFYDVDIASSITITGQFVVKEASDILNKYAIEKYNLNNNEEMDVYNDTDSVHFTCSLILKKLNKKLLDSKHKVTKDTYDIANDLNVHLNNKIVEWAKTDLNSIDPRFYFKREAICPSVVYVTKKQYMMYVKDKGSLDSPKPCDKVKYVGISVVKSTMSDSVKKLIKKVLESILYTKNKIETDIIYRDIYNEFKKLPLDDIAFRSNLNNYNKYADSVDGFICPKHTPVHVKSSIYYNILLKEYNLTNNYTTIQSGDKIKWFYSASNKYSIDTIAYAEKFPPEIDIIPNYEIMFEKIVANVVKRIYSSLNWNLVDLKHEYACNLFELLS